MFGAAIEFSGYANDHLSDIEILVKDSLIMSQLLNKIGNTARIVQDRLPRKE